MTYRPVFPLRFRDVAQKEKFEQEAKVAGVALNEYILRKLEGPKLDISRRQVK